MALRTALTAALGIEHPILLAPMASVSGGMLAAAVTQAGGLGFVGGGYGDREWLEREISASGNTRVGIGFITWRLALQPELLAIALERQPAAVFLSFGSVGPFSAAIKRTPSKLMAQVQSLTQAREALEAGADILVTQGAEAGGHGARRATLPLVPAIVDIAGSTPVVAAGGIADGRGLAAALMLGASGVLCGTAFYASNEALSHANAKAAAVAASGDDTERSDVFDIARGLNWPAHWNLRAARNAFSREWGERGSELRGQGAAAQARLVRARETGDFDIAPVIVGEAVDLVRGIEPAADIVHRMASDAEALLRSARNLIVGEPGAYERSTTADRKKPVGREP